MTTSSNPACTSCARNSGQRHKRQVPQRPAIVSLSRLIVPMRPLRADARTTRDNETSYPQGRGGAIPARPPAVTSSSFARIRTCVGRREYRRKRPTMIENGLSGDG